MSFVSGVMMGASIGTTIHDMIAGKKANAGSSSAAFSGFAAGKKVRQ